MTDTQRETYARAVERHSDSVYRLAVVYLRDPQEAGDCCQDVFIKLMERRRGFESEEHRKAWLLAVTKNVCRDRLRRLRRGSVASLDSLQDSIAHSQADPAGEELLALIFTLPQGDRDVLYLHYYEGYSVRELCALLRLRESAAKQRLSRARARLRDLMNESA